MGGRAGGGASGGMGSRSRGGGGEIQRTGFEVQTVPQQYGEPRYVVNSGRKVFNQDFPFTSMNKGAAQAYSNQRLKGKSDEEARKVAYSVDRMLNTKAIKAKMKAQQAEWNKKAEALKKAYDELNG